MENNKNIIRTHRVGSITAGLSMMGFGILFLLHSIGNLVSYQLIFSLWPVILIGMGLELLLSNFMEKQLVYDKAAVFLMVVMTFFAMGIAMIDVCIQVGIKYL